MKSPSTLIPILEKCIKVQEAMATAESRFNEAVRSLLYHAHMKDRDMIEWYEKRIEINKAIHTRLKSYYTRLTSTLN